MKMYRHLDVFPRGANVTVEVFHRTFERIVEEKGRLPKKFYIQVCGCESVLVIGILLTLVASWTIAGGRTRTDSSLPTSVT